MLTTFSLKAQWTIPQGLGGPNTLVTANGGLKVPSGIILGKFADLTAADASQADFYEGSFIYAGTKLYLRQSSTWVEVGASTGTVTSVSDLAPLFTTSTPTAAATFVLSNAGAWQVFGRHSGSTGVPSYGKLNLNSIDATGTLNSTTFLRGDGSWQTPPASQWITSGSDIYFNTGKVGIGTASPASKLSVMDGALVPADADGLLLGNTSTSTVGVVYNSPGLILMSKGWNTSTLQDVESRFKLESVSTSSSSASNQLFITRKIGAGAYANVFTIGTTFNFHSGELAGVSANQISTSAGNLTARYFSSSHSLAGTNVMGSVSQAIYHTGSVNTTGTSSGNIIRSFYSAIAITAATGTSVVAFQNTVGNNFFNSTSGTTVVGANTPASTAKFEVQSTTQGAISAPVMTTAQRTAIVSPASGLQVYDSNLGFNMVYNGTAWVYNTSPWQGVTGGINYTSRVDVGSFTNAGATYAVGALGQFRSAGGFNLRGANFGDNIATGLFLDGGLPAIYSGNNISAKFGIIGSVPGTAFELGNNNANLTVGTSGTTNWLNIPILSTHSGINTVTMNGINVSGTISQSVGTTAILRGLNIDITSSIPANFRAIQVNRGDSYFGTTNGGLSVGTNTTIAPTAILDLTSTTKGFLPPRLTAAQAEAIASPAEGLILYSTDGSGSTITSKGWWGYDGSAWVKIN